MIGKLECRVFAMNKAGKCNEKEKKGVVGVEGGRVALTRSWLPIIPNT